MFGSQREVKFGAWRVHGHPQIIEYSQSVMNEILMAVAGGYGKLPRGGVEVGGVLFGTGDKHLVRILASRPITCAYTSGPSFRLSPEEHEGLAELIRNSQRDAELKDLVPVGWYHSHTRSDITLTDSDLDLHERHFTESWQTAIILQPESSGAARLGIFVKSPKGKLPTRPTHVVEWHVESEQQVASEEIEQESAAVASPEPDVETPADPVPFASMYPPESNARSRFRTGYGIAAGVLLIGALAWAVNRWLVPPEYRQAIVHYREAAVGYWDVVKQYWTRPAAPVSESPFSLSVAGSGTQLIIRWDPSAEPLRGGWETVLEITDGETRIGLPLNADELLLGFTTYQRSTDNIKVCLKASRADQAPVLETARFVGAITGDTAGPETLTGTAITAALRTETRQLEEALRLQTQEADSLAATLSSLRQFATARSSPPPVRQPEPGKTPQSKPMLVQKVPTPVSPGSVILEQRPQSAPPAGSSAQESPSSQAVQSFTGADAGKLIWMGSLAKNQVLTIQGRRPSTGNLSGQLPGTPVRVSASPAELSSSGLTVFSGDPKYSKGNITEVPGPRNAWNHTTYRWAPDQAIGVEIVEAPGQRNNWSRLVLRASDRTLSVIVADWERDR